MKLTSVDGSTRQNGHFKLKLKLPYIVIFFCFALLGLPISATIPEPPRTIRDLVVVETTPELLEYLVWGALYAFSAIVILKYLRALRTIWFVFALLPTIYYAASIFLSSYVNSPATEALQLFGSTALAAIVAKSLVNNFSATIQLIHRATFLNLVLNLVFIGLAPDQTIGDDGRWSSLVGNPNYLASLALLNVFLLMVLSVSGAAKGKFTILFMIVPIAIFIGTRSATSSAALIVVSSLFVFFSLRRFDHASTATIQGGLLLALILVIVSLNFWFTLFLEVLGKDITLTGRTAIWSASLTTLPGHFLFGHGVNVTTFDVGVTNWPTHFHNGALHLIMSIGMVGLIVFLLPLLAGLVAAKNLRNRPQRFFIFGSIIIFLLFNTTEVSIFAWRHPIWLLYLSALLSIAFLRVRLLK